jgi:hypothetical protein
VSDRDGDAGIVEDDDSLRYAAAVDPTGQVRRVPAAAAKSDEPCDPAAASDAAPATHAMSPPKQRADAVESPRVGPQLHTRLREGSTAFENPARVVAHVEAPLDRPRKTDAALAVSPVTSAAPTPHTTGRGDSGPHVAAPLSEGSVAQRASQRSEEGTLVQVSIGRIDVVATTAAPPAAPRRAPQPRAPSVALADYLRAPKRSGGGR